MRCVEKDRLLTMYRVAVEHYFASVESLNRVRGTTLEEEFEHLASVSQHAWVLAEAARLALEGHTETHEC